MKISNSMQNKQRDESCSQNASVVPAGQFAPFQPEDVQEVKTKIAGPRPHVSYDLNTIFHDFNLFPDNKWEPYADPIKCPQSSWYDARRLENGDRMDKVLRGGT